MRTWYRSTSFTYASGASLTFKDWVPPRGPTGGRNVIDYLLLSFDGQIDVATANTEGEDMARVFSRIKIDDIAGERYNLSGDQARIQTFYDVGARRLREEADVATGNNSAVEWTLVIPFTKPWHLRPEDFAIPAEILREVTITCPANLTVGTSAATFDSGSYYITAVCHEEDSIELKVRDIVRSTAFRTASETDVHVGGGYLMSALFHAPTTTEQVGGGASVANFTDHYIDGVIRNSLERDPDGLVLYSLFREVGDSGATTGGELYSDSIKAGRAVFGYGLPLYAKVTDGPYVPDSFTIRATNTVSSLSCITRFVGPRSPTEVALLQQKYGFDASQVRVKSASKTKRALSAWGDKAAFMPLNVAAR